MPVTCSSVTGVTDGHRGYLRQFRMAVRAFSAAIAGAGLDERLVGESTMHLVLAEPDRPGMDNRLEQEVVRKMTRVLGISDLSSRTSLTRTGHAGVFDAIQAATAMLAAGRARRVLVGGIDGYLDELTLEWLNDTGRLKTEANPKGFVPGEAAAFLVLEQDASVRERGGTAMARIAGAGTAMEANSVYEKTACTGDGLSTAIRSARQLAGMLPLALTICDLNGERYRANEWGLAMSRAFDGPPPGLLWHPADSLGDCGAAAGVLNVAFGTLALTRRVIGDGVLVWGSSDDGERGAAVLTPPAPLN
jgi:3-oxoacyl-[acyl-carrier-protein] synthase-1